MPRQPSHSFWCKDKVKNAFMIICKRSYRPAVDWSKFRKNDEKGIFADYTNAQLSMKFRKLILIEQGICYYCGVKPAAADNYLCDSCGSITRQYSHDQKEKEKKNAPKRKCKRVLARKG